MASKKRGLGRGLDALLGDTNPDPVAITQNEGGAFNKMPENASSAHKTEIDKLQNLPIEFLQPGKYQPRKNMHEEKLQEMADSIASQGIMQPLIIRNIGENSYEIIAGERRWRAAQLAGLAEVPVIIRNLDDKTALALALIENLQREDLTPLEEAHALMRLRDEFNLTQQEIGEAVGKSRPAVANLLRLLNLDEKVKTYLNDGKLEMGHARALLVLEPAQQINVAKNVVDKNLTVRETEVLVKKYQNGTKERDKKTSVTDPNIKNLENRLSNIFAAKVEIKHNAKGNGKLQINYSSMEELDGILNKITRT